MRIDRVGTSKAPAAPAPAPTAAPAEEAQQSFGADAAAAVLALQPMQPKTRGRAADERDAREPDRKKAALESIDDIAARASLNIVNGKTSQ